MKFIETTHKYIDGVDEYTPVSYFIKSFQEYVDWDKKCREKAEKLGVTYEELRAQWDKNRDDAATKGTKFHKKMEDQMIAAGIANIKGSDYPITSYETFAGVKEDPNDRLTDDTVYLEKMIWSKTHKVCGTADLVQVVNGKINVLDYKTNKKLDKKGWFNPKTRKVKKLKAPVSDLDDCNFNIYQLQLNTYMYMLLQANRHLKMGHMVILHIIDELDSEGNPTGEHRVEPHVVANLQSHIKSMFKNFEK